MIIYGTTLSKVHTIHGIGDIAQGSLGSCVYSGHLDLNILIGFYPETKF